MVSILILTKDEAHNIDRCLSAVLDQDFHDEYEVVVIDSGSTDGTIEKLQSFPVRLVEIEPAEFHHARTRNLAASQAHGEILVYLAADAFPAGRDWLAALLRNFTEPQIGGVYGRHLPKPGSSSERRHALHTLYGDQRIVKGRLDRQRLGYRYYHFSTVNAAIRKYVWEQTLFPEDLKVFEDVAIAKRILDGGWKIVYEPGAAVYHSHDYPLWILFKRYFDIGVVYRRLHIWDEVSSASMNQDGKKIVREKLARIRRGESLRTLAMSLFFDLAKYVGLVLGRNERLLPIFLKKHLSAFKIFE
jgi:rhamnosyltransferase